MIFHSFTWCLALILGLGAGSDEFSVQFKNFRSEDLDIRWDDGSSDGIIVGHVSGFAGVQSMNTFTGHKFFLARKRADDTQPLEVVQSFVMRADENTYVVEPAEDDTEMLHSPAFREFSNLKEGARWLSQLTTYHEQGELKELQPMKSQIGDGSVEITFRNFRNYPIEAFWDDGSPTGVYNTLLDPMSFATSIKSYEGHAFNMMRTNSLGEREQIERFVVDPKVRHYVIHPDPEDTEALENPAYLKHLAFVKFADEYFREHGIQWVGSFPPDPASLPVYSPSNTLGEVSHVVEFRPESLDSGYTRQSVDVISLTPGYPLAPVVFLIRDLLTPEECDHVVSLAAGNLQESLVGKKGEKSKVRTSTLYFVRKDASPMMEVLMKRFADVFNISDQELKLAAEDLQVVRYELGQEYGGHNDYDADGIDRLATLLIYLEEPDEGGETAFPSAFGGKGIQLRPSKGSAILFYSQLRDGNMDDLAWHASFPVTKGLKRVCNLWLHSHGNRSWDVKLREAETAELKKTKKTKKPKKTKESHDEF